MQYGSTNERLVVVASRHSHRAETARRAASRDPHESLSIQSGRLRRRGDRARTLAAAFLARYVCSTDHADRLRRRAGRSRTSARGPAAAAVLGQSPARAGSGAGRARSAAVVCRRPTTQRRRSAPSQSDDDSTHQLTGGISLAVSPNGLDPRTLPTVDRRSRKRDSVATRSRRCARRSRARLDARAEAGVRPILARRYRVAQEPVSELVKAAFDTGREVGLDPLLLLSVMAIESGLQSVCGKRCRRARA